MRKKKQPRVPPAAGDRVRLRGREHTGELIAFRPDNLWSVVAWDWECFAPEKEIPPWGSCHLNELEKI